MFQQRSPTAREHYYRDGVADSQYQEVKDFELTQIRDACADFINDQGWTKRIVKLTAVVCTKRHHTRFYPDKKGDMQANANNNCKPRTLVERSVTHPYFTDFHLQSHNGLKGTAKPAHYFVLANEMEMSTKDLQYLVRISRISRCFAPF